MAYPKENFSDFISSNFTTLKEFDKIKVVARGCDYFIRGRVVIKSADSRPALLLTKIFTDSKGNTIETTKLGRILHSSLPELNKLITDAMAFIATYIESCRIQHHGQNS